MGYFKIPLQQYDNKKSGSQRIARIKKATSV